ncbi:anti-sigma factor [Tellurirhabdus bombi]|uniref:anti-sigma factor n=1 Tax=Tellurirhabdus bombi TaxID=2907205 RepID=UPI001F32B265|nr:anti-sigma factor [Tellurirhabdus bombi]
MNINDYIASGILEEYVLGTVNPQEKREVECLSGIYPEIKQELDALSVALEQYALTLRREPPADVKNKLLKSLDFTPQEQETTAEEDAQSVVPVRELIPLERPAFRGTWIAAASIGLLFLFFSIYLYSQLRTNQQTMAMMRDSARLFQEDIRLLRESEKRTEQTLAVAKQPGTRVIQLDPVGKGQKGPVMLFWNSQTGEVRLEVDSLVRPPEYMQYQLWAIVDGKPVDAGVFDIQDWLHIVQTQKKFARAEAFAITVEKRGGNPTPTMETMVVMGKTNA